MSTETRDAFGAVREQADLVGAAGQPDVVGARDQANPHLLAVDHVLVAVGDGGGAQIRQIGAAPGSEYPMNADRLLPRSSVESTPSARRCRSAR